MYLPDEILTLIIKKLRHIRFLQSNEIIKIKLTLHPMKRMTALGGRLYASKYLQFTAGLDRYCYWTFLEWNNGDNKRSFYHNFNPYLDPFLSYKNTSRYIVHDY